MASSKARSRSRRPASSQAGRPAPVSKDQGSSRTAAASSATPTVQAKGANGAAASQAGQASQPSKAGQASQPSKAGQASQPSKAVKRQPVAPAPPPDDALGTSSGPPLWLQIVSFVLAILGLAISAYETYAHYSGKALAGCPTGGNGTFNCAAVIDSPQSMVFGVIPVAVLGLAFYVFAVAIFSPWAWRMRRREVHQLRLASLIVGMGFVIYLIYAELYQIGDVCEYCSGVHIVTFLLFCITVVSAALWGLGPRRDTVR